MNCFKYIFLILIFVASGVVLANSAPVVREVLVSPKPDGSGVVNISYTLSDADNDRCTVSILVSNDGGNTWTITPSASALDGHLTDVSPGRRYITWNSKTDLPGEYGTNYRVKVTADDGIVDIIPIAWVLINDPGFNGEMSKYETTNAQYCEFLNSSMADGLITVYNNDVYAVSDTSHSEIYFEIYTESSSCSQISYDGSTFSVRNRDGYDMTNHPVVEVSWYGATVFCNYYGYSLPTESEWQAVADHHGEFTYGCGTTISHSKANYNRDNPLNLSSYSYTTSVDYYPSYGYGMNDMAGNVWEWTSSVYNTSSRFARGGDWYYDGNGCTVSIRLILTYPDITSYIIGFRVCR